MKGPSFHLLILVFLLLCCTLHSFTPFCATLDPPVHDLNVSALLPKQYHPAFNDFLQCLAQKSQSSHPIYEAIYTPKNSSFVQVLLQYIENRRYSTPSTPKPLAIVAAKHESHVQATVVCAKQHGLQIRIRSGGHDYEGLSSVSHIPFVVLDMFNLRSIDIDLADESAWVQSGATIGELFYAVAKKSKVHAVSAGSCPSVGIGGHFSGGGYGPLMRKYGLTVDNVEDAKIVNVNGRILDRKSMGEDLFWAIRGGGGASFGVILSWKIKLLPVPPKVTVFYVRKTLEQGAVDVVHEWQYVAPNLPKEIFIRAALKVTNSSQEGQKTGEVLFTGFFLGETNKLLRVIKATFPKLGLQKKDCIENSWIKSTLPLAGCSVGTPIKILLTRPKARALFFKSKSDYVKKPMPKKVIESIWKKLIKIGNAWVQLNPYGGRMSEISESQTPFPHRAGNLFSVQYFLFWREEGLTKQHLKLARKLYESMTPSVSKHPREAIQNYRDLDIGANLHNHTNFETARRYGSKYFKGNFERLVRVKTAVDPHNFFNHEQSIPPQGSPPHF